MPDPVTRLNSALEGRYRIERQLGEGGMATVYLADDLRHERSVALKVLKPELAAVVGAERFLAEIKTTANLQHPHILPLFDSGEADSFLFYVMPYVEGESLRQRLDRESQLPVDEAVQITRDVAAALDYAHSRGVIHRDVKPANILLHAGKPVVSDFGIALAVGAAGGGRLTDTGLSLGTPHYMSPEQATGGPNVGAATDIYALGCVLYETLAGDPPYTASTPQGILGKIVTGELEPVSRHRRGVPANVESALAKALEKVPADRFRSAAEFATALANPGFRHGQSGALAGGVSQRSAVMAGVIAAAVASVITGTVVWSMAARQAAPGTQNETRFSLGLPGVRGSGQQAFYVSPDGQTVYVKVGTQVFARPLGSLDVTPVRGAEGIGSVFVSADGEWLGFNGPGPVLSRLPIAGGQLTTITEMPENVLDFRGASWSSEGTIVFASGSMPGLMQVAASGGAAEPLTTPPAPEVHGAPHVLPGGEHVLFEISQPDIPTRVAVLSTRSGEYSVLVEGEDPQYVEGGYLIFQRDNVLWGVRSEIASQTLAGDPVAILQGVAPSSYTNFSVSPNGTLVYAPETTGFVERALVWVDRRGESVELPFEHRSYGYPRISPSGDRLAVAVGNLALANDPADLWVLDLRRFAASRVTFGGNNRFFPVWTPDGRWLTHADGASDPNRVLRSAADGVSGTDTLMTLGSPRRIPGTWSPDGRALALQIGPAGTPTRTRDILVLDVSGGEPISTEFLATSGEDSAPAFSPDGKWVAYVSDRTGRNEVYVTPYPGPGLESTISTDGGSEAVWSLDGTELFYRTPSNLMAVDVELGDTFRAGPPRVLFEDGYDRNPTRSAVQPNYDVAADGRFIMVRAVGTTEAGGLVIVQNWRQELRELLGS